jgi:hypothetical protein
MRILLDESLPKKLGFLLDVHTVRTVQQVGFSGLGNGVLLAAAANDFDVLITVIKTWNTNKITAICLWVLSP